FLLGCGRPRFAEWVGRCPAGGKSQKHSGQQKTDRNRLEQFHRHTSLALGTPSRTIARSSATSFPIIVALPTHHRRVRLCLGVESAVTSIFYRQAPCVRETSSHRLRFPDTLCVCRRSGRPLRS